MLSYAASVDVADAAGQSHNPHYLLDLLLLLLHLLQLCRKDHQHQCKVWKQQQQHKGEKKNEEEEDVCLMLLFQSDRDTKHRVP